MKRIKIFLVCSIADFRKERLALENFIHNVEAKIYHRREILLEPVFFDNLDDARKAYKDHKNSEQCANNGRYSFLFFFAELNRYTAEEFGAVTEPLEKYDEGLFVYFRVGSERETDYIYSFAEQTEETSRNFYGTFSHVDTIKIRILLCLKFFEMPFLEVEADGASCTVDARPIMKFENLLEFENNKYLKAELTKLDVLTSEHRQIKEKWEADSSKGEVFRDFCRIASERKTLAEDADKLKKCIFSVLVGEVRCAFENGLTPRQKRAYRAFERGDYEGSLSSLDPSDIDSEFQNAQQSTDACVRYIREHKSAVDILRTMKDDSEHFSEIDKRYDKIIPLIIDRRIELDVAVDYVDYLIERNQEEKLLEIADALFGVFEDSDPQKAIIAGRAGGLFYKNGRFDLAEQFCFMSADLFYSLAEEDAERFDPELAVLYNNCAVVLQKTNGPELAEQLYFRSLSLRAALSEKDSEQFYPGAAQVLKNIAVFYERQKNYVAAENYSKEAVKLYSVLAKDDSEKYNGNLARCYESEGNALFAQGKLFQAEECYRGEVKIRESVANDDPKEIFPSLALNYDDLGACFFERGDYESAKGYYGRAIDTMRFLWEDDPESFFIHISRSYIPYGNACFEQGKYAEAKGYYTIAFEKFKPLAEKKLVRFVRGFAAAYSHIGRCCAALGDHETAESCFKKASDLLLPVSRNDPQKHDANMAINIIRLAALYASQGKIKQAEELYLNSVRLCRRLDKDHKKSLNNNLAEICNHVASFYYSQGKRYKAAKYCRCATKIYLRLTERFADRYQPFLADSYFNYGKYSGCGYYTKKARKIAEKYSWHPKCRDIIDNKKLNGDNHF